jgi:hypothetical protein
MDHTLLPFLFASFVATARGALPAETPWPYVRVPASAMRATRVEADARAALAESIEKPGGLGLPERVAGRPVAWRRVDQLTDGGCRVAPPAPDAADGTTVLIVGHFHSPVISRTQDYRFRLACNKRAVLFVDGRRVLATAGMGPVEGAVRTGEFGGPVRYAVEASGGGETRLRLDVAQPGDVHFFAALPERLDRTRHVTDYRTVPISNGVVHAVVAIPDVVKGYYRANRFEQAGFILSLDYKGHSYFPEAPRVHDPLDPHQPVGPCEECIDPMGWDDARPGEPFIKFGVGLYEKPFHPEALWYNPAWPIRMFGWKTRRGANWIEFTQDLRGPRGWGYHYVKRVVLPPGQNQLRIEHELLNTGAREIDSEQYNHNWVCIDGAPPASGYSAEFPFAPRPLEAMEAPFSFGTDRVDWASNTTGYVKFAGFAAAVSDNRVRITARGSASVIEIGGDTPLSHAALFVNPEAFCFEPFVRVRVKPGERTAWTRIYTFTAP